MIKLVVLAIALVSAPVSFAGDQQLETLNQRLDQQSSYLYSMLSAKASSDEMKKIRDKVNGHIDVRFDGQDSEDMAYRSIRKVTYLKTFLGQYYSASEVKMIMINAGLIATFGRDKLGK